MIKSHVIIEYKLSTIFWLKNKGKVLKNPSVPKKRRKRRESLHSANISSVILHSANISSVILQPVVSLNRLTTGCRITLDMLAECRDSVSAYRHSMLHDKVL